jgi:hypothetical protein
MTQGRTKRVSGCFYEPACYNDPKLRSKTMKQDVIDLINLLRDELEVALGSNLERVILYKGLLSAKRSYK